MDEKDAQQIADLINKKFDAEIQKAIGMLEGRMDSVVADIGEIKETNIRIFKRLDNTARVDRCKNNESEIERLKERSDSSSGSAKMLKWIVEILLAIWLLILSFFEIFKGKFFG